MLPSLRMIISLRHNEYEISRLRYENGEWEYWLKDKWQYHICSSHEYEWFLEDRETMHCCHTFWFCLSVLIFKSLNGNTGFLLFLLRYIYGGYECKCHLCSTKMSSRSETPLKSWSIVPHHDNGDDGEGGDKNDRDAQNLLDAGQQGWWCWTWQWWWIFLSEIYGDHDGKDGDMMLMRMILMKPTSMVLVSQNYILLWSWWEWLQWFLWEWRQ